MEYEDSERRALKNSLIEHAQQEVDHWNVPSGALGIGGQQPLQLVDFFCGCGGMSLGFAAVDRVSSLVELTGGCDIDKDALATYSRNFGVPALNRDIRELAADSRKLRRFVQELRNYDPDRKTILVGCAPCQGFTAHRKRDWDSHDYRNTLVSAFASVAVKMNPDCIVMENVPEMLSAKYWGHFEEARGILESSGFVVSQAIYNAAMFGVPQDRFRALVIAMKKPFLLPSPQLQEHRHFKTVRDSIGNLPEVLAGDVHESDEMHRSAAHKSGTLETIRAIPKDGGSRPPGVGPKCLDRVKGFYDVYGRLHWDRPAITITHYARNPASGRFIHPSQDRGLTMREAARLQSFPDEFEFVGRFDSVFRQIGEAVAPRFAAAVAASCVIELVSAAPTADEIAASVPSIRAPVSNSFSSVIAGLKQARRG